MKHQPPRFAKAILRRFCHVSFIEEVEGDLDEQFYERIEKQGLRSAKFYYCIDVTRAVFSGNGAQRSEAPRIALADSLRHFFKIFFRGLKQNRSSSFINIVGLALSLASFIAICLYVVDELTFDSFHPGANNVYRISHSYQRYGDGAYEADARAGGMWVSELKQRVPEIKAFTRFSRFGWPGSIRYEKGDKNFEEQQFFWADSNYTDIFSLPMIVGDPSTILRESHNVIVNETIARKYFGNEDPVGKELIYSWDGFDVNLVVAGVMKNYPSNAHFHPDFIGNNVALDPLWKRDGDDRVNSWYDTFTYSFFRLEEGTDPEKALFELRKIFAERLSDYRTAAQPILVPLVDIHFTRGMVIELETPGEKMYANIAASVGILILFIAGVNYMNLATARSIRRAKEVGLRKTVGMRKAGLISMFMGESFMLVVMSFVLSITVVLLLMPFFNEVTGKTFDLNSLLNRNLLTLLGIMIVILTVFAGSYPALYLSSFKPVDALKGQPIRGVGAENFRRVLIVFQFSITFLLVVSAVIINQQVAFIRSGKLANRSQVLTVRLPPDNEGQKTVFRDVVKQTSIVEDACLSNHLPHQSNFGFIALPFIVSSVSEDQRMWDRLTVDENFARMFDLEFIAGRNFSSSAPADSTNVIVNEAAVRELQLTPDEAIGREIRLNMEQFPYKGVIIGVTKDFPFKSIKGQVTPAVLFNDYRSAQTINIALRGNNLTDAIADIEQYWKKVYPGTPFKYWFMDGEFDRLYRQEMQMQRLSGYFTVFAIVIACLGLFGLASFTAEQKTKEIGIRKVLGASVQQIVLLLSSRFVRLVLISYVIAMPLALFLMNLWLGNFAYKVPIEWYVFTGAAILILILTCVTVGIEAIRAALANPVESIRHE